MAQVTDIPPIGERKTQEARTMTYWWWGTVVLAFFPILAAVLFSLLRGNTDILRIIIDGELILSSFLVTTPTLIGHIRRGKGNLEHLTFSLLFLSFFQLLAYALIKTNEENMMWTVITTSAICVITSIFLSWLCERKYTGGTTSE
ncbi:MAG: hypothetical protein FWG82_00980 [Oscillospiraceae bacterium]|nr:hypothetical protein [Oscillospiraceae bacterium]